MSYEIGPCKEPSFPPDYRPSPSRPRRRERVRPRDRLQGRPAVGHDVRRQCHHSPLARYETIPTAFSLFYYTPTKLEVFIVLQLLVLLNYPVSYRIRQQFLLYFLL
jgi:hypothetical protein